MTKSFDWTLTLRVALWSYNKHCRYFLIMILEKIRIQCYLFRFRQLPRVKTKRAQLHACNFWIMSYNSARQKIKIQCFYGTNCVLQHSFFSNTLEASFRKINPYTPINELTNTDRNLKSQQNLLIKNRYIQKTNWRCGGNFENTNMLRMLHYLCIPS